MSFGVEFYSLSKWVEHCLFWNSNILLENGMQSTLCNMQFLCWGSLFRSGQVIEWFLVVGFVVICFTLAFLSLCLSWCVYHFCSTPISSSEFPPLALETLCQTPRTSNMPIYVHGCKVVKWLCVLGNHFIYVKKNSEQIVKVWWSHNFKLIRTASLRTLICEHLFVHPIELILSISQYYRLPF